MKAYEHRAAKRSRPLLRDPQVERPDCDTMVVVLVEPEDDEPYVTSAYDAGSCRRCALCARPITGGRYVTSAYDAGSCWRCALCARPITGGRVVGWMHVHEAVKAFKAAKAAGGGQ
jgi:MinD superfamily P-loop ATPase